MALKCRSTPSTITSELLAAFPDAHDRPTRAQVADRRAYLTVVDSGKDKLESVADLEEALFKLKMPETKAECEAMPVDAMMLLPGGDYDNTQSWCFSSMAILQNIEEARKAYGAGNMVGCIDGTYKLDYDGRVFIVFGTKTFTYDGSSVVHSFRPWAYSLARTESKEALAKVMRCTKAVAKQLFDFDLDLAVGLSDQSEAMQPAFEDVFPAFTHINCYPHIIRKVCTSYRKSACACLSLLMNLQLLPSPASQVSDYTWGMGKEGPAAVQELVRILHLSRSDEEFGIVANLICEDLRKMGAKEETISTFYNANCVRPTWHICASGIPGITPDQNPQEAYNGAVKRRTKLLQPLAELVNNGLPKIVKYDSENLTGTMAFKPPAVPDSKLVHDGAAIWAAKGQLLKVNKPERGIRVGVYVNSTTHGTGAPVTKDRIRGLNAALAGKAPTEGMTTKDYAAAYMSLHLVDLVDGVVRCDCKAFWHSLVCKHSLAAEHALQMRDLLAKVKPLKGTKRGRGSKTPKAMPALVRQPRVDDSSDGDGAGGAEGSDGANQRQAQPKRCRPHKRA